MFLYIRKVAGVEGVKVTQHMGLLLGAIKHQRQATGNTGRRLSHTECPAMLAGLTTGGKTLSSQNKATVDQLYSLIANEEDARVCKDIRRMPASAP